MTDTRTATTIPTAAPAPAAPSETVPSETAPSETAFCETAWERIRPIREAVESLPFVRDLRDGSLDRERFRYYLTQDALYLATYGRSLAAAAAQSTTAEDLIFWSAAAGETLVVERQLHAAHVDVVAGGQMSPTCTAYTSYLLGLSAGGCYPELAAGVLPCFWIYEDVGTRLKAGVADLEQHPYGDWISMYGDPAFAESTRQAKAIVDRLAHEAGPATRDRMMRAFVRAAQYEWMFWDAADRKETWPIG